MSQFKRLLVATSLIISSFSSYSIELPKPPTVKSESYIVVDYDTGEVVLSKDENKALSPASVTKLMTAYVVLKEIKKGVISKDDNVKISKNAVLTAKNTKSSRTFLEIGDEVNIKELLKGLIVQSGNDAAIALAEHVAGRESSFSELMNYYANNLGMKNSFFRNASGLPKQNHYTTSQDLSKVMIALIKEFPEEYSYYFSIKSFTYNKIKQPSRNKLLFSNPEFDGGKTGWHNSARYCYVASVLKKGRRLVVATLNAPSASDRFADAIALTNYAYRYFENHKLIEKGVSISGLGTLPVFLSNEVNVDIVPDKDIILTLKRGEFENLVANININDKVIAPMKKGESVGFISIKLNNKTVGSSDIVLKNDVMEGSWFDVAKDTIAINIFN